MISRDRTPNLTEKLRAEGPGILAWMIEGALDWQRNGLIVPDAVRRATDDYMLEQDHFARFLLVCCKAAPGARTATLDLHGAYEKWQEDESESPALRVQAFSQEMQRRGYESVEKAPRSDGKRGAGFKNIRLRVESEFF